MTATDNAARPATDAVNKSVMVFAEHHNGAIRAVCYELLGKGRELADALGAELNCAYFDSPGADINEMLSHGADRVYYVEGDKIFDAPDELLYAANLVRLIKKVRPEIVLFGATPFGRSLAPRVAASLGAGLTADCTELAIDASDGKLIQIRPAFSGNILARIMTKTLPQMATVRGGEFREAEPAHGGTGEIIKICAEYTRPSFIEIRELRQKQFDITDAEVIVAAGAGLKKASDFEMIKELAELLNGSVGASRPLVENGFIAKDFQVGYSGSRVRPKLYVACGISGSAQHMAGMKDSETIVAINADASAPIFNIADIGVVGDMYEVIPAMIRSLYAIIR